MRKIKTKKKRPNPQRIADELRRTIKRLAAAASANDRHSTKLKVETERALKAFGKVGVQGSAALALVTAICAPPSPCANCGCIGEAMSGTICVDCADRAKREAHHRSFRLS